MPPTNTPTASTPPTPTPAKHIFTARLGSNCKRLILTLRTRVLLLPEAQLNTAHRRSTPSRGTKAILTKAAKWLPSFYDTPFSNSKSGAVFANNLWYSLHQSAMGPFSPFYLFVCVCFCWVLFLPSPLPNVDGHFADVNGNQWTVTVLCQLLQGLRLMASSCPPSHPMGECLQLQITVDR